MSTSSAPAGPHVVVIGGGFGGIQAARVLGRAGADVTLIDRHNYHLFQPLSYQVATGSLAPSDIAVPLRQIFRRESGVRVLMAEVDGFDLEHRRLRVRASEGLPRTETVTVDYDYLIVSGGSAYAYFGHDEWRSVALEVKSLDSALQVRGRILEAFEAAEVFSEDRTTWLTFVVVGAGPTGVEMAGQIAELANDTLPGEFSSIDPRSGRVLLVEMTDHVLGEFPARLSRKALGVLEKLGVTPMLSHQVTDVQTDSVTIRAADGAAARIPTRTVIWAAGVEASPLARTLADAIGGEVDLSGRLTVESDLSLPGHPEVMAIGDMVRVRDPHSGEVRTLPGLAPVAMQQGRYAGRTVLARIAGEAHPTPFRYRDKGTLATIGRAQAVAKLGRFQFSGLFAWLTWLVVHIFYLIGFENRVIVLFRWALSFFTRGRGSRLITQAAADPSFAAQPDADPAAGPPGRGDS